MTELSLRDVVKEYRSPARSQRVLDGASLSVEAGEFVAITGPSGSGKSTLLNLCSLLDRPDAGDVILGGRSTTRLDDTARARIRAREIGIVLQTHALFPHRSVLENVLFRFRYVGASEAEGAIERARARLSEMGLGAVADQPARLLSGGEMQRAAIARAVVLTPRVLVADEPTGNLDGDSAGAVMACFRRLNEAEGITVLMATHDLSLVAGCDRHLRCRGSRLEEVA